MARLLARSPCEGLGLPMAVGEARLSEVDSGPATLIAPFAGKAAKVEALLGALPTPGQVGEARKKAAGGRLVWVGPGRALLLGAAAPPGLDTVAAVIAQGDGMACVRLEGPAGRDVLARLVPLDLGDRAFPEGAAARTLVNHMAVTLMRVGPEAWEVLAMRSMAGTLVHELHETMERVAARAVR